MTTSAIDSSLVAPGVPGPAVARLSDLPGVNLMPTEIAEKAELQRIKVLCAGAVAVSVVLVGGLYFQAHSGVTSAKSNLASAEQQQTTVQGQVNALAYVAQTYATVEAAKAQVAEALGGEIRWSGYLDDLSLSIPANVWLTNMTVAAASASTATSATGSAATAPAVATITFTGAARTRDDVADWLESLVNEKGYANPYVTSTTETKIGTTTVVDFSSTLEVTSAALSGRYTAASGS